jgi:hypothetical protein
MSKAKVSVRNLCKTYQGRNRTDIIVFEEIDWPKDSSFVQKIGFTSPPQRLIQSEKPNLYVGSTIF